MIAKIVVAVGALLGGPALPQPITELDFTGAAARPEARSYVPAQFRIMDRVAGTSAAVMVIGDSIAGGWTAAQREETFGRASFNFGFGGDKTQNVLWRLEHTSFARTAFDAFVVVVGANNVGRDAPPELAGGIVAVVRKLHGLTPGARAIVVGIPPRGPALRTRREWIERTNLLLAGNAPRYGYEFVDLYAALVKACRGQDPCPHFRSDRVHLMPSGYGILGDEVRQALAAPNRR